MAAFEALREGLENDTISEEQATQLLEILRIDKGLINTPPFLVKDKKR